MKCLSWQKMGFTLQADYIQEGLFQASDQDELQSSPILQQSIPGNPSLTLSLPVPMKYTYITQLPKLFSLALFSKWAEKPHEVDSRYEHKPRASVWCSIDAVPMLYRSLIFQVSKGYHHNYKRLPTSPKNSLLHQANGPAFCSPSGHPNSNGKPESMRWRVTA